jgi:hypothetical protein
MDSEKELLALIALLESRDLGDSQAAREARQLLEASQARSAGDRQRFNEIMKSINEEATR